MLELPKQDFRNRGCEEAHTLSRETYIPCGRPAVAVVWSGRDGKAYRMCVGCADHNIHARRCVLLAVVNGFGLPADWIPPQELAHAP